MTGAFTMARLRSAPGHLRADTVTEVESEQKSNLTKLSIRIDFTRAAKYPGMDALDGKYRTSGLTFAAIDDSLRNVV
jgi:hypothetical protein